VNCATRKHPNAASGVPEFSVLVLKCVEFFRNFSWLLWKKIEYFRRRRNMYSSEKVAAERCGGNGEANSWQRSGVCVCVSYCVLSVIRSGGSSVWQEYPTQRCFLSVEVGKVWC